MLDEELFAGLSTYQDVVIDGAVVRAGRRSCVDRWRLIEPWLPKQGALLDVGSNFGWFALAACRERAQVVVASVEADERSAAVQRAVLAEHEDRRVCLVTRRAGPRMARRFAAGGQQFAAVFGLSVLHWIPRHREFLQILDPITGRFFVELPEPSEPGAGDSRLREEMGDIGDYLAAAFPGRQTTRLGETTSHRDPSFSRPLWLVHEREGWTPPSPSLAVAALCQLAPAWPPRSWWRKEWERAPGDGRLASQFTPRGVVWTPNDYGRSKDAWRRRLASIPESSLFSRSERWKRAARNGVAWAWNRLRGREIP